MHKINNILIILKCKINKIILIIKWISNPFNKDYKGMLKINPIFSNKIFRIISWNKIFKDRKYNKNNNLSLNKIFFSNIKIL